MRNLKKIMTIVAVIYVALITHCFAESKPIIKVEDVNSNTPQEEIIVKIDTQNFSQTEKKIIGIKFDLEYDNNLLQYISSKKGDASGYAINVDENKTEEGRLRVGLVSIDGLKKDGDLYEVKFKVNTNLDSIDTKIDLRLKEVTDSTNNQVETEVQNGTIKIGKNAQPLKISITNREKNINEIFDLSQNNKTNDIGLFSIETNSEINENILKNKNDENQKKILDTKVENQEILKVMSDGTIIPKSNGKTKITVIKSDGTEETADVNIVNPGELEEEKKEPKENKKIVVIIGIVLALIVALFIIYIIRRIKRK